MGGFERGRNRVLDYFMFRGGGSGGHMRDMEIGGPGDWAGIQEMGPEYLGRVVGTGFQISGLEGQGTGLEGQARGI